MIDTLIQWSDDSVNATMGCTARCELRPSPEQALKQTLDYFRQISDGTNIGGIEEVILGVLKDHNATEIFQFRGKVVDEILELTGEPRTAAKAWRKGLKAALDKVFICYSHQQHMMRGSDITNPYKRQVNGFPTQFEQVTKYPGRMALAAARPDLYGTIRATKPWLDYLPRIIFVSDMGDSMSVEVDFDYLKQEIIDVVSTPRGRLHLWLWLTKEPKRMAEFADWLQSQHGLGWPDNLVAMTSVTSGKTASRVRQLLKVPARRRGISAEPLWGDVTLPLEGIDICIVGGQSGGSAERFDLTWIDSLKAQCAASGTALFVKQLGALPELDGKPIHLKDEHGGDWNEWPPEYRIREIPPSFWQRRNGVLRPNQ